MDDVIDLNAARARFTAVYVRYFRTLVLIGFVLAVLNLAVLGYLVYLGGRQQTGAAIASINDVTIAAIACAQDARNDTVPEVRICVTRKLGR